MSDTRVFLFGAPRLERDEQPVPLGRSRALALLAYLCLSEGQHTREALLDLLWPTFAPADARNNLRRELSLLKSVLPEGVLLTDRHAIGLDPTSLVDGRLTVDALVFAREVEQAQAHHPRSDNTLCDRCAAAVETAVTLQTQEFLAGFTLPDSPAFDEWQFYRADYLRGLLGWALERLADRHDRHNEHEQALDYARRWAALDTLNEAAHRLVMRLFAASGRHGAALRQYETLRRTLHDELGRQTTTLAAVRKPGDASLVEPEPETVKLYDTIRVRRATANDQTRLTEADYPTAGPTLRSNLPAETTPFIGREKETAQLAALLGEPRTRLITILGAGGMGKTRLALAVARHAAEPAATVAFPDGVFFVPLAPVSQTRLIAPAIALGLGFTPASEEESSQQVIVYLKPRRVLLLIDNLEHLINGESVAFFGDILRAAPAVKLLVTSRTRLGLGGEHVFTLTGLDTGDPTGPPDDNGSERISDAVALFVEAARRAQPSFRLDESNHHIITRICARVGGLPLGIELAAGWVELLSTDAILAEIERSPDFLTSDQAETPPRQTSLRAVFESSWRLLATEEQRALVYLSIFPGTFNREAAEQVGGVTLRTLLSLLNKSWLQSVGDNRYHIHPFLRQYAAQEAAHNLTTEAELRNRHADYFAAMLAALDEAMRGGESVAAFDRLTVELDNLQAALMWLIGNDRLETVEHMAIPLLRYLESRYVYFLFQPLIVEATRRAEATGAVRIQGVMLTFQGAFFFNGYPTRFMDYQWVGPDWQAMMQTAWDLLPPLPDHVRYWDILVAWHYGRFVNLEAGIVRLKALTEQLTGSRGWYEAFAQQSMGRLIARRMGERANDPGGNAAIWLQSALELFETLGDEREAAITLMFMGFERQAAGDLEGAERTLPVAQERLRALGEPVIAANINWQLAEIHMQRGEMEQSLACFHEMGDLLLRHGLARLAISGMSRESYEAVRYGDLGYALRLRQRSLALSQQTGDQFNEAWDCWEMGEIYRVMGQLAEARRWNERSRVAFHAISVTDGESFYRRLLGDVALADQDAATAERHFRACIREAKAANHPWQQAYGLAGLGTAVLMAGRQEEAAAYLAASLRLAHDTGDPGGLVLMTIARIARFFRRSGQEEQAADLARLVLAHPLSWRETRDEAARLLDLSPDEATAATQGEPIDLRDVVEKLIAAIDNAKASELSADF